MSDRPASPSLTPAPQKRWRAAILVVSDGVAAGTRDDRGGPAVSDRLTTAGFDVVARQTAPDGVESVATAVGTLCAGFAGLVVTTGGTGFGPRDLTPEGTSRVLERTAPGLAEAMRAVNPLGRLTRGECGTIGAALVVNLPGSPGGAVECLDAIIDVLPHALTLLSGERPH